MKKLLILFLLLPFYSFAQPCADEDTVRANAATLITATTARINGTTDHMTGSVLSMQLKYVRVGLTDTITVSWAGTTALRNLTGLYANTQYYYYYKSICASGTMSQTIGAYTFTTLTATVVYAWERSTNFPYVRVDTGFTIPRLDTGSLYRAADIGGNLRFRPADSLPYYYNGDIWKLLAVDSAGIMPALNRKVDSVTVSGDSLWYWIQGVSYGYILPAATAWDESGNAGTVAGTNFLGTTDSVALWFNTYGANRLIIAAAGIASSTASTDSVLVTKTDGVTLGKIAKSTLVGSLGWLLNGNTVVGEKSIGTIDNYGLGFITNNVQSGYISTNTLKNTSFGYGSLPSTTFGSDNTAIGYNSLFSTTFGIDNTAIGSNALYSNGNGGANIAIGSDVLYSNTAGTGNAAIGHGSLYTNTGGSYNTSFGYNSLNTNTVGDNNIAIGVGSGQFADLSNRLYINSIGRVNILGDTTKSIIYGAMDSTAANQRLYINSRLFSPYLPNTVTGNVVYYNSTTGEHTYGTASTGTVTGTGTTNYVPKWTPDGTTLGNSTITDDGTTVGLISPATSTTGLNVSSSTITSGALATFTNTGTAAASNTKRVAEFNTSGANVNASQTVTAVKISNTNTGTTSTNVGLNVTASGATNNVAVGITAGLLTFGGAPSASLPALTTSPFGSTRLAVRTSDNSAYAMMNAFGYEVFNGTNRMIGVSANTGGAFPGFAQGSDVRIGWGNISSASGDGGNGASVDVALTRVSAGLLGIGTGAAGAVNAGISLATVAASTSLTSPLLIGGTGTTSPLTYKTTTGVGTTGADHIFQVGNNGATEAMRILNSGNVGIGTTSPTSKLHVLSTATTGIGSLDSTSTLTTGSVAAIKSTSTVVDGGSGLNISMSGANSTASKTVTGQTISVTNTGTTSTNVGLNVTATGASTNKAIDATGSIITNSFVSAQSGFGINGASGATQGIQFTGTTTKVVAGAANAIAALQDNSGNTYISSTGLATTINGVVTLSASVQNAYRGITALRTLDATDHTIEVTANTFTVTLPTAVGITGRKYVITNSGSGVTTVGTTSSQTFVNVSGTPTTLTLNQFSTVILQSNGANWLRLTSL